MRWPKLKKKQKKIYMQILTYIIYVYICKHMYMCEHSIILNIPRKDNIRWQGRMIYKQVTKENIIPIFLNV